MGKSKKVTMTLDLESGLDRGQAAIQNIDPETYSKLAEPFMSISTFLATIINGEVMTDEEAIAVTALHLSPAFNNEGDPPNSQAIRDRIEMFAAIAMDGANEMHIQLGKKLEKSDADED